MIIGHESLGEMVGFNREVLAAARAQLVDVTRSVTIDIVSEKHFEVRDVTPLAAGLVAASGLRDGSLHAYCPHTTCGLMINEAEDGLHEDLGRMLERVAAKGEYWAHDDLGRRWQNLEDENRPNGHSHIRSMVVAQPSILIPIEDGELAVGCWQRLLFVELDGSRHRTLRLRAWGSRTAGTEDLPPDQVQSEPVAAMAKGSMR